MPQSLLKVDVHLTFSTKNRAPLIAANVKEELHKYLGGILAQCKCPPIRVGGVEDHVRLFFQLARTIAFCDLVEEVKKGSSKWMKTKGVPDFYWQNGYGGFAVGETGYTPLIAYIEHQEEHHRKQSFQDEFRAFLRKHGLEWDERYVWD